MSAQCFAVRIFTNNSWQIVRFMGTKAEAELFAIENLSAEWDIKPMSYQEAIAAEKSA